MSEDVRVLKRRRVDDAPLSQHSHSHSPQRPHVFAPFRTIGLVSPTSVPFTSVAVGKTTFQITTSVGNSLQTYDVRKGLHLNFLTKPQTPQVITATAAWKEKVVCAWGGERSSERGVWLFRRGTKEAELALPKHLSENVKRLCIFGSWIVGVCDTRLVVWKSTSLQLYTEIQSISPEHFSGCIASLPTFLNKVIVGRNDGSCEIWNISTAKLIYTILPPSTTYGAVTAIEPTPALSIAAIAYENGYILIQDVEADQTLIQLDNGHSTPATSISFRTDGIGAGENGLQAGVMAVAAVSSGDITFFDLNKGGRKAGVLRSAHTSPSPGIHGGISGIEFLPGQAVIVSSGLDNSLKTWIFDETPFSPVPRILHQRSGHAAPVSDLSFLPTASDGSDDTGKWLLSGSLDRSLWCWSLRRDAQSSELSQSAIQSKARKKGLLSGQHQDFGHVLKCPPISKIACSLNRDGGIGALPGKQPVWQNPKPKVATAEISAMTGWESVITAHEGDAKARTWFWGRRRAGRWAFATADGSNVTSVAMSPCGTFALVGSAGGSIDMYNMQSGQHRQHFPARLTPVQAKQLRLDLAKLALQEEIVGKTTYFRGQGRHHDTIVGLGVDEMNKAVMSAGRDGRLKFWNFQTGLLEHEIDWSLSVQIVSMTLHRRAGLVALVCADSSIRVVDITTFRLIRELRPSRDPLPELASFSLSTCIISHDARWIIASMGPLILVWDIPTGHLIDAINVGGNCTSVDLSPTGEHLAVTVEDRLGVEIWTNRALFSYVPTRQLTVTELLSIVEEKDSWQTLAEESDDVALVLRANDEQELEHDLDVLGDEMAAITTGMISLSVLPRSRWQNLLYLDLIRQRNKPVEPPKRPEKAPFFLPANQDRQTAKATANGPIQSSIDDSRVVRRTNVNHDSVFTTLLRSASETDDYDAFLQNLKQLSPAAADVEIRSLSTVGDELVRFVQSLIWLARRRTDFELGQAWMAVFLRVHGDVVRTTSSLRELIREWHTESARESQRVQKLAEYCGGVVSYMRAARV